jgi:hypothetical protein
MYSYVVNNPLRFIDPLGLFCVWDDGSYDANDDPVTGSFDQCQGPNGAGGTWFYGQPSDWNLGSDWTSQANGVTAEWASEINPSGVGPAGPAESIAVNATLVLIETATTAISGSVCMLTRPLGQFNAPNAVALFQPQLADPLGKAFGNLNQQGIVPTITSGFRNGTEQQRMIQGASGPYPAATLSLHQEGLAVDINSKDANFPSIKDALTGQGLTWGGTFSTPDPVHFQAAPAGTRANAAMVAACGGG